MRDKVWVMAGIAVALVWATLMLVACTTGLRVCGGEIKCDCLKVIESGAVYVPPCPSPTPVVTPTPSTTPTPTPSPISTPTPSPIPTPTPSPITSPTPTPTPTPSVTPTPAPTPCPTVPDKPVLPLKAEARCPPGQAELTSRGIGGDPIKTFCLALSECGLDAPDCSDGQGGRCHSMHGLADFNLNTVESHHWFVTPSGEICDIGRDCYDRYGRRYAGDRIIVKWDWSGICPPAGFTAPCPTVTPSPGPTPTPPPSSNPCPAFQQIRGSLLACRDEAHQLICQDRDGNVFTGPEDCHGKEPRPTAGGSCTVDTTQGFAGCPRGCPCDEGHPCDGRTDCFDPRGQAWTWSGSAERCDVDNSPAGDPTRGFQLDCKQLRPGSVTWTACVPDDGRTARGEMWRYALGAERCITKTFEVR